MGMLLNTEFGSIRQVCSKEMPEVNYTKQDINSAVQALEDWWVISELGVSATIDNATAPFVFTVEQKNSILNSWLKSKSLRFLDEKKVESK